MYQPRIEYLILPGWQGSPEEHWQSHWQQVLPYASRVEQADWLAPSPEAWVRALEDKIASANTQVILIAHSLGCITVARWAAQARQSLLNKVKGALLVAPADVERPLCPAAIAGFAPIAQKPLPFPSLIVGSDNDSAASVSRVLAFARYWHAGVVILPKAGHINVKSGHTRWEQGFAHLYRLQQQIDHAARLRA